LAAQLPSRIAFAHLDGDLYESILTSLTHVYPRLSQGAICLIDDYADPACPGWNGLPGVKVACDEYLRDKPERVSVLYAGDRAHGFLRKA
jgi:O-methyltransferase